MARSRRRNRDETLQAGVFAFADDAHATAAEFFDDAVVRDGWPISTGASGIGGEW
jgi:hypothetical protein